MKKKYFYFVVAAVVAAVIIIAAGRIFSFRLQKQAEQQKKQTEEQMVGRYRESLVKTTKTTRQLVLSGLDFAEKKYFDFALAALERVVETEPNYRDGLIAYSAVILKKCEVKGRCEKEEVAKAARALEKAAEIDPLYEPTKKYLGQIKEMSY